MIRIVQGGDISFVLEGMIWLLIGIDLKGDELGSYCSYPSERYGGLGPGWSTGGDEKCFEGRVGPTRFAGCEIKARQE